MFHPGVNLLIVFFLIVILIRVKLKLGMTMTIAAILLGILFKVPFIGLIDTLKRAIISQTFLQLGIALNIIVFLENVLRKKGYLQKTTESLRILIPNSKINIMLLPAFLGLLPSPGGAMFSAPLVTDAGRDLEMSPETKSMVNYWFRHVWEYFIPLYPGVLLASKILSVPVNQISFILSIFFIWSVGIGYFLIIKDIPLKQENRVEDKVLSDVNRKNEIVKLLQGIWPVLLIVGLVLFLRTDVGLTVILVLCSLLIINRYRRDELKTLWREAFQLSLVFLIAGVLYFKEMLITTGVVNWLPLYFKSLGIPEILVVSSLTFLVAIAIGLSQGYVAATFPLLTGIIGTGSALNPGMFILAFVSGFVGIMLTPLHLCMILTIDHYHADFYKVWKRLLFPELLMLSLAFLLAFFWR